MDMEQEVSTEEPAQSLKEKFNKGTEAAKKYANQAKDAAKEYAYKAKDMTQDHIKENPFRSMLVALGVGVLLGVAFSAAFGLASGSDED